MIRKIFEKLYFDLNTLHPLYKDFWIFLISEVLAFIIMYVFLSLCYSYGWFYCYNCDENMYHCYYGLLFFVWFFCFYSIIFYELWIEQNLRVFSVLIYILKTLLIYIYSHISDFISKEYSEIKFIHFCKLVIFFYFFIGFFIFWFYFFMANYFLCLKNIYWFDLSFIISCIISFIIYINLIVNSQKQKLNSNFFYKFWISFFFFFFIYLVFVIYLIYLLCMGL